MASTGTSTERIEPRNKKITRITISNVSLNVMVTSWIASRTYSEAS